MSGLRGERGQAVGLVLAAGTGSRFGRPKALVEDDRGSWLRRSAELLTDGGCDEVVVVLGAAADEAAVLVADLSGVSVVVAHDHEQGMSASLRTGLDRLARTDAGVAVITLVDLPDLHAGVVARLLDRLGTDPAVLGRASFGGRPGHPVVLGRRHWSPLADEVRGDAGARDYLDRLGAALVECGDLADGRDVDTSS